LPALGSRGFDGNRDRAIGVQPVPLKSKNVTKIDAKKTLNLNLEVLGNSLGNGGG